MKTNAHFMIFPFLLRITNVSDKRCRKNQNTRFMTMNAGEISNQWTFRQVLVLVWDSQHSYANISMSVFLDGDITAASTELTTVKVALPQLGLESICDFSRLLSLGNGIA